jgi:hypothetical protein
MRTVSILPEKGSQQPSVAGRAARVGAGGRLQAPRFVGIRGELGSFGADSGGAAGENLGSFGAKVSRRDRMGSFGLFARGKLRTLK